MSDLRAAAQQALEALALAQLNGEAGLRDYEVLEIAEAAVALKTALAELVQPVAWTDADADAARLAMELEALLLSCKDTAAVSRWWDSAHDALELHRQRLSMERLANQQKTTGSPCPTCEALARAVMMDQTGAA